MARDITDLGPLDTGTITRAGSVGSEDLFNLPGRGGQVRATDWYTFTLPATATSLVLRSTGGSDMYGALYRGTMTAGSALADLGTVVETNDDNGPGNNFQISRTNQAAGRYTIAVQGFNTGAFTYTLEIVAAVRAIPNRDAALTATTGLPTTAMAVERIATTAPARPARPSASAASLSSLSVSWAAPDDGGAAITAYAVRYRAGSRGPWIAWPHAGVGTSTTITGLTVGTSYQVQVRAQNRIGESGYSLSATGATSTRAPARPAAPAVRVASSGSINVSWVAPSDGGAPIDDYDVRYRAGSSGPWTTWPHIGTGTSTRITGLAAKTSYEAQVRAGNSVGKGSWSSSGTASTSAVSAVVTLEIDWGNDGTFSHVAADVTSDLVKHSLRTTRGRTLQSRRKAVAGRLECRLWNLSSKYDPFNSSSPIYERDIAGLRMRAKLADTVIWAGRIDSQRYRHRPVPQLDIIALGVLSTLRQPVSVAGQTSKSVGAVAKLVGAAAGIATTHLAGGKTIDRWPGVSDQDALFTLHNLEDYEEGFLKERADGELELEAEDNRATGDSAISALAITDQISAATDIPLLRGSALDWGFRQIANVVNVPVTPLAPLAGTANVIVLWSTSAIKINPGVTLDLRVGYPEDDDPVSHRGVSSWIDPVGGIDYTSQFGLAVSGAADGNSYLLSLSNTQTPSAGVAIAVGRIALRGTPLVAGDTTHVQSKDAGSITAFGEREYARPSPLFTDIGQAQAYADGVVSRQSSPHGWIVARWPAEAAVENARSLDLSRRITLTRLGKELEYYIEGVGMTLRGFVRMEYLLSPVPGVTLPSGPVVTVAPVGGQATQLAVSWSAPFDGGSAILDYDVRYKKSTASAWIDWPHMGTGRTTTITGLVAGGASYDVQVRAKNAQGNSSWSDTASGATLSVAPTAPSAPTVSPVTVGISLDKLDISWSAPSFDGGRVVTDYDVQYREGRTGSFTNWPFEGIGTSTTITGLLGSTVYQVRVRASNSAGASGWSAVGEGTVSAVTVPPAPTLIDGGEAAVWQIATNNGSPVIRAEWDVHSTFRDFTQYVAERGANPLFGSFHIAPEYTYMIVRLENSAGWGPFSAGLYPED